jgi:hypothetical protein
LFTLYFTFTIFRTYKFRNHIFLYLKKGFKRTVSDGTVHQKWMKLVYLEEEYLKAKIERIQLKNELLHYLEEISNCSNSYPINLLTHFENINCFTHIQHSPDVDKQKHENQICYILHTLLWTRTKNSR